MTENTSDINKIKSDATSSAFGIFEKIYTVCERYFKLISWLLYLSALKLVYIKTNYSVINYIYLVGFFIFTLVIFTYLDKATYIVFNFIAPEKKKALFVIGVLFFIFEVCFMYKYVYFGLQETVTDLSQKYS